MISVEGDVERQRQHAVVRRKVVGPKEMLAAQLDRGGEEAEHRNNDRHLDQQRDTTAHRVDTGLLVELHRRLLALHGILLARIFLGQLIDLGLDDAHLGRRYVTFIGQRRDDDLHQHGQDQDNQAETRDKLTQEIEHRNHEPAVHPAENTPAERNQPFQMQFVVPLGRRHMLENGVFVRTEIESEVVMVGLRRIGNRQFRRKILYVTRAFFRRRKLHISVGEVFRGDHHRREELLLESHPVERRRNRLLLLPVAHPQIVGRRLAGSPVIDGRIGILVLKPFLVLIGTVAPIDADSRLAGHLRCHIFQIDIQIDQIIPRRRLYVINDILVP